MNRAQIAAVVLAGIVAGVAVAYFTGTRAVTPPELERATLFGEPRALPGFALVDDAGAPFVPERLLGHWTFLFFGFVNCPDVCPTTLAQLADVRRRIAAEPGAEPPEVVLVSVDPGRDTPAVLARYVTHFDPSFTGVTGDPAAIAALTDALGVAVVVGPPDADGNYAVDHTAALFLVDPDGRFAALFTSPHEAGAIARDYRAIAGQRG